MSIRIQSEVWEHSQMKEGSLLVLLALADNADNTTHLAWPSVDDLARRSRLGRRQTQYCLRKLEEAGEIKVVRQGGRDKDGKNKPTLYRVFHPDDTGMQYLRPSGDRGALHDTSGVQPSAPEPSVEPSSPSLRSGEGAVRPSQESGPKDLRSYGVQRLMDFVTERKEAGNKPDPLPSNKRGEYGNMFATAVKDNEPVEDCEAALYWLVKKAAGEIPDEKQAWAYFGTGLRAAREERNGGKKPMTEEEAEQDRREAEENEKLWDQVLNRKRRKGNDGR